MKKAVFSSCQYCKRQKSFTEGRMTKYTWANLQQQRWTNECCFQTCFPSLSVLPSSWFCCMWLGCCSVLGVEQWNHIIKVGFSVASFHSSFWQPLSSLQNASLCTAGATDAKISVQARNGLLLHLSKSFPCTTPGVIPCSSLGPHKLWWGGGFSHYVKSPFLMFCQTHRLENHCPVTEWRY